MIEKKLRDAILIGAGVLAVTPILCLALVRVWFGVAGLEYTEEARGGVLFLSMIPAWLGSAFAGLQAFEKK